ncbi:Rik1-associated factor 1 like protein [Verticillium longisporum]|nr:Rik1-associated factor 1 like protein [Verticillium longisporum]
MRDRAYTSSFDKTVKIWKFPNKLDISMSDYIPLSGTRAWNEDDKETQAPQKWSYYPATMRWGIAKDVQHFLLVGYSPRSITGDDNDIPLEKQNSGEICLWNCKTGKSVKVMTGSSQNVFEVAWHPTQPCFIVASSPFGKHFDDRVKTQIRIFTPADVPELYGAFNEVQCLDCPASDINELTIMPCSLSCCYITAAATDGNVYVWDTARGDNPIHVLRHGSPIGDDVGNDDTGVKFTAWGTSQDRFYTGGSDGMVKVWNIRNRKKPLVRDLLQVDAPISSGVFSPNRAKLAIGDASGRVSLLSVDKADDQPAKYIQIPAATQSLVHTTARSIRVPKNFTPHLTPLPPAGTESESGIDRARAYVAQGNLQIHQNRCIGAVQGPAYAALGFYRGELHKDGDHNQPLLAATDAKQQENQTMFRSSGRVRRLRGLEPPAPPLSQQHQRNQALVLDLRALPESTQLELAMEGVKLDDPLEAQDWDFEYEEE